MKTQIKIGSLHIFIFIFIFLLIDLAAQQKTISDSIYTLDSIVVKSTRGKMELLNIPFSIIYFEKEKIQKGETGISLDEISVDAAGVDVNNRHNFALGDKITMRGIGVRSSFGVRGIKIIYDGIPLTLPDGQTQLNNIDLTSAGQIEFVKGPASSLYGNSAGGVINIQTEDPSANPVSFSPQIIFGSYGLQKYSAKISGTGGTHSYFINFNQFNLKGYREHSSSDFISVNSVFNNTISENIFLKSVINYFNSPYLLNPGSINKYDADKLPETSRGVIKQQGVGEKLSQIHGGTSLNIFYDDFNLETTLFYASRSLLNPIPGRIIELKRSTGGLRSVFSAKFISSFTKINFLAGIDFEFQFDNRKEFENLGLTNTNIEPGEIFKNLNYGKAFIDQDEKVFNAGPFLTTELIFNDRWRLLGGLRFDYYEFRVDDKNIEDEIDKSGLRVMKYLSPMIGIVYRLSPASKIYLNYSTSFLTPTTSELSNLPDNEGGFNPYLNPEKIKSFEIGSQAFLNKWSISGAAFYMNINDILIPYQVGGESEEIFFRNAGKAGNTGVEFTVEYFFTNHLRASLNYTYMHFIFKDFLLETEINNELAYYQLRNNKVPGLPDHKIGFTAGYYSNSFYSKITINWNDKFFTNDFNGPPPPVSDDIENYINSSFTEINFRIGYNFSFSLFDLEIFGGINNLLNQRYNNSIVPNAAGGRFFEPAPLRNWYAGFKGIF